MTTLLKGSAVSVHVSSCSATSWDHPTVPCLPAAQRLVLFRDVVAEARSAAKSFREAAADYMIGEKDAGDEERDIAANYSMPSAQAEFAAANALESCP
jgi:hypothetical protein